jgi:hypothetical protein
MSHQNFSAKFTQSLNNYEILHSLSPTVLYHSLAENFTIILKRLLGLCFAKLLFIDPSKF